MPTVTVPARPRDDQDFRRYWLAKALSITGSMVTAVALLVLVYRLSGSTVHTALIAAFEAAPTSSSDATCQERLGGSVLRVGAAQSLGGQDDRTLPDDVS
jgi:hypothetical protein